MGKRIIPIIFGLCLLLSYPIVEVHAEGYVSYPESTYEKDYVCSKLNKSERRLYDQCYDLCLRYLTNSEDVQRNFDWYSIGPIDMPSSDTTVLNLFRDIECKKKFFYIETYMTCTDGEKNTVWFIVRDEYVDGKYRKKKSLEIQKKLGDIVSQSTDSKDSDLDKAKKIHDYLCRMLSYDLDYKFDQCIDQVLMSNKAVCGSYSNLYSVCLNMAGVESIVVASDLYADDSLHAWNMIKIGNSWYHTDITWDDRDYDDAHPYCHEHFLRSEKAMSGLRYHVLDSELKRFYPSAPKDYYSSEQQDEMNKNDLGMSAVEYENDLADENVSQLTEIRVDYNREKDINDDSFAEDYYRTGGYYFDDGYEYRSVDEGDQLFLQKFSTKCTKKGIVVKAKNRLADGYEFEMSNNKSFKSGNGKKTYRIRKIGSKHIFKEKKKGFKKKVYVRARAYKTTAGFSGGNVSNGGNTDRVGYNAAEIADLINEIEAEKAACVKAVSSLSDQEYIPNCIVMRLIIGYKWQEVAKKVDDSADKIKMACRRYKWDISDTIISEWNYDIAERRL